MDYSHPKNLMIIAAMLPTLFLSLHAQTIVDAVPKISPATKKLLVEVCAQSETPSACVDTLSRNPKVSSATDMSSVARIALAAVRKDSQTCQGTIRTALRSNPEAGAALRSCLTYFDDTIKELVIRDGDLEIGEASLNVHYALDSVGSCETAMADAKVNIQQVTDRIHLWKDMFNVAYFAVTEAEDAASGM